MPQWPCIVHCGKNTTEAEDYNANTDTPASGRKPTEEELAEALCAPVDKIKEIVRCAREPVSLETPIGEEEDSHLGDFIPAESSDQVEKEVMGRFFYRQILDAEDGHIISRFIAPDGIQASELAWMGETIYVSGVSEGGYGIYKIGPDGSFSTELEPSIQKLVNLDSADGRLQWTSDLDGANALYSYDPATRKLTQLTSTRFGSTDFCFAGDTLYSISQTLEGQMLFSTPADSLLSRKADFSKEHVYPIEDRITHQEKSFRKPVVEEVEISAPKRYRKLPHLMRFHSWAPIFFDYDDVESFSMDYVWSPAAPGLTGYFQNTLGTMSGMVGMAVRPDPYKMETWRPSLHAKFKYSGLYPVIEGSFDFGDTMADIVVKARMKDEQEISYALADGTRDNLQVSGTLRAPF